MPAAPDPSPLKDRTLRNHLLALLSAFEWTAADLRRFESKAVAEPPYHRTKHPWVVDTFIPAYRDAMYFERPGKPRTLRFSVPLEPGMFTSVAAADRRATLGPGLQSAEVFFFPDGLGIFCVRVDLGPDTTLDALSNAGGLLRSFDSKLVRTDGTTIQVDEFIRDHVLHGIKIRGEGVSIDDYSGSKLKSFVVADATGDLDELTRRQLLYDLGCFANIGAAQGEGDFAPSRAYFDTVTATTVSVFAKWSALGLYDAFACVGTDLSHNGKLKIGWSQTYLHLYVFNLYVKFAAQRMGSDIEASAAEDRARNERFLVEFDVTRVSYNFLPNLLHIGMRSGLEIGHDFATLRERIVTLSRLAEEQLQKRSNFLLGIVSLLTGGQAYFTWFDELQTLLRRLGIDPVLFWSLATPLLSVGLIGLFRYLAPRRFARLQGWMQRRALTGQDRRGP